MERARALVVLALACATAMVGAVVYGASTCGTVTTETAQDVVRAERFELVDSKGRVRAVLGVQSARPLLVSARIVGPEGNVVPVPEAEAEAMVRRGGQWPELPHIEMRDADGRTRVEITLGEEGEPAIRMMDEKGKVTFAVPPVYGVEMLER